MRGSGRDRGFRRVFRVLVWREICGRLKPVSIDDNHLEGERQHRMAWRRRDGGSDAEGAAHQFLEGDGQGPVEPLVEFIDAIFDPVVVGEGEGFP